jgi:putative transcriptional regulator
MFLAPRCGLFVSDICARLPKFLIFVDWRAVSPLTLAMRLVHTSKHETEPKGTNALALRLRDYRLTLGLSQAQLARRLGMKQPAISLIERGRRRPSATLLHRLADMFHVDTETLFLLSHSSAKLFAGACRLSHAGAKNAVWRAFTRDNDLLARYNVKSDELRVLSRVRIIGEVRDPRDFICILTTIRQALKA